MALIGTIVHVRNYRDSDRIVQLLSAERGMVAVLARGARASKRRFAGVLDQFVDVEIDTRGTGSLPTLIRADALRHRFGIRTCYASFQRASLLSDMARTLAPEHSAAPEVASVLSTALDMLEGHNTAQAALAFVWLVRAAGCLPNLKRCHRCGDAAVGFAGSGVWCASCYRVSAVDMAALRAVTSGVCADEAVADHVQRVCVQWLEHHMDIRIRAAHVVPAHRVAG